MKQTNNDAAVPAHQFQQRQWGFVLQVLLVSIVLPVSCILLEYFSYKTPLDPVLIGKWFIFWGFGARSFIRGLMQAFNPAGMAMRVFNLRTAKGFAVVKELGLLNICLGITGILSLFFDSGRTLVAITAAIYLLLIFVRHLSGMPGNTQFIIVATANVVSFSSILLYLFFMLFV